MLLVVLTLLAAAPDAGSGELTALKQKMDRLEQVRARFTQTRRWAALKDTLVSRGTVTYDRRGRLSWKTEAPGESELEYDGKTAVMRYPNVGTTGRPAFHTSEVEVADVDNDGDLDVMAGAQASHIRSNSHLVVMRNDGSGAFPTANGSSHALNYVYSSSVLAGDLNDDGYVDLVGTLTGGSFTYFLNDGAGNFPAGVTDWSVGGVGAATLADLNGSGQGSLAARRAACCGRCRASSSPRRRVRP